MLYLSSMRLIKILFLLLIVSASANAQSSSLKKLSRWMAGSFSSYEQHMSDSDNYYHIKLDIIPIWTSRRDGFWFYVEQAVDGRENRPYRQRAYHLWENKWGEYVSSIYKFDKPLRFTGNWQKFDEKMTPQDCTRKDGCDVILNFDYDEYCFVGGTKVGTCRSKRGGSAYATAEVKIYKHELYSWDRGWNDQDEYVWGAENAGYIFLRE